MMFIFEAASNNFVTSVCAKTFLYTCARFSKNHHIIQEHIRYNYKATGIIYVQSLFVYGALMK